MPLLRRGQNRQGRLCKSNDSSSASHRLFASLPVLQPLLSQRGSQARIPGTSTRRRHRLPDYVVGRQNPASAVSGVALNDDMSAQGITVAGAGLISNTCGGVVTATPGATSFSLVSGAIPIAPGGGSLGSCDIVVEVTSTIQSTRTNTLASGAVTGNDGAAVSNGTPAAQSFNVLTLSPPTLGKSFSPTTVVQNSGKGLN